MKRALLVAVLELPARPRGQRVEYQRQRRAVAPVIHARTRRPLPELVRADELVDLGVRRALHELQRGDAILADREVEHGPGGLVAAFMLLKNGDVAQRASGLGADDLA